jgi:hypothetical protein
MRGVFMSYLTVDIINRPFIKKLIRTIKLDKQMTSGEKSKLLSEVNKNDFIPSIKRKLNKKHFTDNDLKDIIILLKGE